MPETNLMLVITSQEFSTVAIQYGDEEFVNTVEIPT
jgi:hypothetical protein